MAFTYAENGGVVGFASELEGECEDKRLGGTRKSEWRREKSARWKKRGKGERERAREKRSLSARSSEKASVQRQGANEIVGYVLSTTA